MCRRNRGLVFKGGPMTSHDLAGKLGSLIRNERKITGEILMLINQALETRAYLELGFPSMFEWLTKGFGYSHGAAYRRIEAARLLRAVPEVASKIESGQVNLSTLAKIQTVLRAQEKASGKKVENTEKTKILEQIERKTTQEVELVLAKIYPQAVSSPYQERREVVKDSHIRHHMNLSTEAAADLRRAKEVLSHRMPHASDADIVAHVLKFFLKTKDPLVKPLRTNKKSASAAKCVIATPRKDEGPSASQERNHPSAHQQAYRKPQTPRQRQALLKASQASCTYVDQVTGQVCGSRFQIEIDHILPKAKGGTNDPQNLRVLCRSHNLMMAEKHFGQQQMRRYWQES